MDNEENTGPLHIQDREFVLYADPEIEWRYGKRPDYSKTNKTLKAQSTKRHEKASLEYIVQNLVRTFEMEATYKLNPKQWCSIDSNVFRMQTNNGTEYSAEDIVKNGTYNLFLGESEFYSSDAEDFETSATIFKETFTTGFVWEVVEVFVGPPKVVFKWRHWGTHDGQFQDYSATNNLIEVFGITIADVSDDLRLKRVEHIFDTSQFFNDLSSAGKCPIIKN